MRILALFLLFLSSAHADCWNTSIVGRIAYFYPLGGTFQQIYKKGGVGYGGEVSVVWRNCLEGYLSLEDFTKRGHTRVGNYKTTVKLYPLNAGLKYYFPFQNWQFYVGGGPLLLGLAVKNETNLVQKSIWRSDLGFTVKVGNAFKVKEGLIDIFIEYSCQKMRFTGDDGFEVFHTVDLSHIKGGVAVGVQF